MVDNTTTIQDFLNIFAAPTAAGGVTNAIASVMALFSPDEPGPPVTPSVGIGASTQDPLGPAFRGNAPITALFTELFLSFPHFTFTAWPIPGNPAFCIAVHDPYTIIIQAQLSTGTHEQQWFPPTAPGKRRYYSKPLSDLIPASANYQSSTVPVCAAFTFDTQNAIVINQQYPILNLALYLDRWKFAQDLWVHGHYPFPHPNG
jgi:hypothetical protein